LLNYSIALSGNAVKRYKEMQLYHHPFSLDSQKVRLALEEKEVDYSSLRMNPLKARNLDLDFFRMSPSGKLPVFKNAELVIFDTLDIIWYIDSINTPLGGNDVDREKMVGWMKKNRWMEFQAVHTNAYSREVYFILYKIQETSCNCKNG